MTTTDKYQVYPDYYMTVEECKQKRREVQTNPRYSNFKQTHFTAGDEEQFAMYRDKTNGSLCMKSIDLSLNVFHELHETMNTDMDEASKIHIGENVDWIKYRNLTTSSVDNTFNYIFYKLKKGCFIKIKDGKLDVFLPFSNAAFVNEWGHLMKQEPRWRTMEEFLMHTSKEAGYYANPRNINPNPSTWYGNNCLIRTEWPVGEGDSDMTNLKDMLKILCAERQIPDMEFFVNKRDFPLIKKNATEPYDAIWGGEVDLVSHNYSTYAPILSQVTTDDHADIPMPTWEDWQRVCSKEDGKVFESCRTYTEDFDAIPWDSKKPIAVFRGASTGCGTTPDTNPRLKLALLSKAGRKDNDGMPFLDAGITKWNLRPRKEPGNQYLSTIDYKSWGLEKVAPLSPLDQARFKYIVHVDGHVSAFRLSYELGSGSVILLADSKYRMWFRKYLVPYKHFVPVNADLSNLFDQIKWCKENDEECRKITRNAREFYDKYLCKKGILDYMQALLVRMKDVNGIYVYNSVSPKDSLISREIEIIREKAGHYPEGSVDVVNSVPYMDPKSFGLMKGMQYLFNRMCDKGGLDEHLKMENKVHQSKNMSINRCSLFGTDMFLVKTLLNSSKDREFIHDGFVGVSCINNLLLEIPNFAYTLGFTPDNHMLRENVRGITFADWMKTDDYTIEGFISIVLQAILAIRVAQQRCGFIHYDMYPWNIIVSKVPNPVKIDYRIKANVVYRLTTSYLVTIIDYGKSHVVYNNTHHGENILFDMPQFQDVLTLLFSSMHELSQKMMSKHELSVLFTMVNYFAGTSVLTKKVDKVNELKQWLQYARKYNNILQYSKQQIGSTDPMVMVDFMLKNVSHEGRIEVVKKVEYTPYIGNERLVYDLMTRKSKEECYDMFYRRFMDCDLHVPKSRLEQIYCYQLMTRLVKDSFMLISNDKSADFKAKYEEIVTRIDSAYGRSEGKRIRYNRYTYPKKPTVTPYTVNTFSNAEELDAMEVDMRCYVMPDYVREKNIIDTVLTLPNPFLTPEDSAWIRREMDNIIQMNAFAVLHELADKGTFDLLVRTTVKDDIKYIRETVGEEEGCDRALQIASNYSLIVKRREEETKMKI
jgi:hypothetical protein